MQPHSDVKSSSETRRLERSIKMTYVFERYTDKGGAGEREEFTTLEEAKKFAERDWNHLTDREQKKFKDDPCGRFCVVRYEDDEVAEVYKDYLE